MLKYSFQVEKFSVEPLMKKIETVDTEREEIESQKESLLTAHFGFPALSRVWYKGQNTKFFEKILFYKC